MGRQPAAWREECVSAEEFHKLAQQSTELETDNGKDFLQLIQAGGRDVVFVTEGYHKQQAVALNIQLPTAQRSEFTELAAPPQLHWRPTVNMLHPAAQLSRELHGSRCSYLCSSQNMQGQRAEQADVEAIPFGVTEQCKLLSVDFIIKQLDVQQQPEESNPFMQHLLPQHEQRHPVLSMRITLQRMAARVEQGERYPEQQDGGLQPQQLRESSSSPILQQGFQCFCRNCSGSTVVHDAPCSSGQQRCEQAHVCKLEYPLFQLQSSDYIVPADVFNRGLQQWCVINNRDKFTMLWDDTPFLGCALKFRQRPSDDPFHASPWRSIEVEWEDHAVDRENDPEDWCYGNPWEMIRPDGHDLDLLNVNSRTARRAAAAAAPSFAPWTEAGAAATNKRKKPRRPKIEDVSDDFTAFDEDMFFYDDDPDDYMLSHDSHLRRKRHRQHQRGQRAAGHSNRAAAATAITFSKRPGTAAAAAAEGADASEPKHSFGREMMGVKHGVCLICRKKGGQLVTGHTSRASQNCSRVYHVGCLLLLNSLGIRSIMQSKQQQRQQQQEAPDHAAVAAVQTDGLLQHLLERPRGDQQLLSPAAAAAVQEAAEAAVLHQDKQIDVCCPAHYCHGCGLNGKHEYMVWCCCCLVHVYHWRNCIPLGAEAVKMDEKDYIRCPACVAAGVPLPGTTAAAEGVPSAAAAELPVAAAAQETRRGLRQRRRRQQQQEEAPLVLQHITQEDESPEGSEQHHGQVDQQQQQQQQRGSAFHTTPDAVGDRSDSDMHDSLAMLANTAELVSAEPDDDDAAAVNPQQAADTAAVGDPEWLAAAAAGPAAAEAATAPDLGSRRQSPAPAFPLEQLHQLENEYQRIIMLQQQYEQQQQNGATPNDTVRVEAGHSAETEQPGATAAAAVGETRQQIVGRVTSVTRGSLQAANIAGSGSSTAATAIKTSRSSGHVAPALTGSSSSGLDALMPAWLRFSLEHTDRHRPSYKLAALLAGSSSSGSSNLAAASDPAAAALRHVAAAVTRLPYQAAEVGEGTTELSLCSPQTHWLIGSADKAESAKYKVTGSWTGCPVIQVPTPDEGVFGLCLVVDHYGLVGQQRQQQQQDGRGGGKTSSRRARVAAAEEGGAATPDAAAAAAAVGDNARIPGVYLKCWKPVMQGSLQQQQKLLQLQQSGDERGGCAYQLLVNDRPFPEGLGRQELQLNEGDVITVQGRRFRLVLQAAEM